VLDPLTTLPDGTIKQVNPFTGTKVWTIPRRGARPIGHLGRTPLPIDPADQDRRCVFCIGRKLDTTPEIARLVRSTAPAAAAGWLELRGLLAAELDDTVPEFRLVPNLFEILSYDYWHLSHGWEPTPAMEARRAAYLSTPLGRAHVESLPSQPTALFAANHQVVIARRHFADGATDDSQLVGSGQLTPEEHCKYVEFAITAMRDLYRDNEFARYVSVFQNWLAPAGASFDHLHKQAVAIDELSVQTELEAARLREERDLYARWGEAYAAERGLVIARTPSAVAFVGVGHRFPSLEVHSRDASRCPWELTPDQVRDVSDLVHACHAATGVDVPTNEEWHHRPPSLDLPMPLRVVLKWRISTLAGFEGGTKIYVNTLSPWTVREGVSTRLRELAAAGALSDSVQLAD